MSTFPGHLTGFAFAALLLVSACGDEGAAPSVPTPTPAPAPVPSPSEGGPIPAEATAWIDANAHPFDGSHLSLPHDDLGFLREMVGDARIVALGEGTHGTRDFFEMKARILRFLVEEMGFNAFGIEATWPESRRLDRYVRTGEGDPHKLLTGLYFWTWRTESVLEMIEWMRAHNEAGGDVGFHGFDMQYPGLALLNVLDYFRAVDPDRVWAVAEKIRCLAFFANDHRGRRPRDPGYRDQTEAYLSMCGASLEEVRELFERNRERYLEASDEDAFEVAKHSLRVAFQYHLRWTGGPSRDASMAENTEWILRRLGPEGRMVLWAHNNHVSTNPNYAGDGAQGLYLRRTFGDAMVIVAFSHETGQFTAVGHDGRTFTGPDRFDLDTPLPGSFEHYFSSAVSPRFALDLRSVESSSPGNSWLAETRRLRSIGAGYNPSFADNFWRPYPLTEWFDVIIHFRSTRPTTLLPALYPESW